jgi:VanZ family protein
MSSSASFVAPKPARSHAWTRISAWLPVLLCIGVISMESTAAFGADHTSGPLQHFLEHLLHRRFTQPEWWRWHIIIRKSGHFLGYGILSLAWLRAFWMTIPASPNLGGRRINCHLLAMLGTLFIASCDEFHQTFLPNRSGSVWDVLVDCSGAALLQLVVWLCWRNRA